MGCVKYTSGLCQMKCVSFLHVFVLFLFFVIPNAEASNRTDSESVQTHHQADLTSNQIAVILYVTITVVVIESFIIFLLGVYVIMNKKKFQPPPSPSVPSISSSIASPSSCSCANIFRRCPKCGYDVMSVSMMPGISVSDETEKAMPGDHGPMFKHGLKHPLDDGIYSYQLEYGHRRGKVHRRPRHRHQSRHHSEGIRLQTAATMSKRSDQLAPLNNLNINLRITTPNHHRHVISDEASLAPKDTPGAGSGFIPFSTVFPKEINEQFENEYA